MVILIILVGGKRDRDRGEREGERRGGVMGKGGKETLGGRELCTTHSKAKEVKTKRNY